MVKRPGSYIVFYEGDKLLLLHRPKGYNNEYSYIGGGIEEGETPEEAVVREVKEELCYDLIREDFKFVGHKNFVVERKVDTWEVDAYMYIAELGDKLNQFTLTEKHWDTGKESTLELVNINDAKVLDFHWTGLQMLEMVEDIIYNNRNAN